MEIRILKSNNQFTVTGLANISENDFKSVLRQLFGRTDITRDSKFLFPEITGGQRNFGYFDISNESTWGILWEKLPQRPLLATTVHRRSVVVESDLAASPELTRISDEFLHTDPYDDPYIKWLYGEYEYPMEPVNVIAGLRGVQGVDGDILGDLARRSAEPIRKPPLQYDRVSVPHFPEPPMTKEESENRRR
jgi:hypothetical protein